MIYKAPSRQLPCVELTEVGVALHLSHSRQVSTSQEKGQGEAVSELGKA